MPMPRQSEPRGARHAALLLHAMAAADRDWMLDALPQQERAELIPLLAELEALGIERDPTLIDAVTSDEGLAATPTQAAEGVSGGERPTAVSDEAMLWSLDPQEVSALAELLRIEPAGLVAEFLAVANWPWRDALLANLEPVQRRKIDGHRATMDAAASTPPALRTALIAMIATRLRERPIADETPSLSPWRRLQQSFANVTQGGRFRGTGR